MRPQGFQSRSIVDEQNGKNASRNGRLQKSRFTQEVHFCLTLVFSVIYFYIK